VQKSVKNISGGKSGNSLHSHHSSFDLRGGNFYINKYKVLHRQRGKQLFTALDVDRSGKISSQEFIDGTVYLLPNQTL